MKIGSHNSMSYLTPLKWYMRPFAFIARCQSKDIKYQYEQGIRLFDIRISFEKDQFVFAHGLMKYKGDIGSVFRYLNGVSTLKDQIYIRIIFEDTSIPKDILDQKTQLFYQLCDLLLIRYKNLKFFEGRRKSDWKIIYNFNYKGPTIDQKVSSMTGSKLDDWFPWLYAFFNNKKNIEKGTNKHYMLLDFVQYK